MIIRKTIFLIAPLGIALFMLALIPWTFAQEGEHQPLLVQTTIHYVAPDGDCGANAPCYASIQTAVITAVDGDIIMVESGTFTESIHINTNVTIEGESAVNTMIGNITGPVVYVGVNATDVIINNITLANGLSMDCQPSGLENHGFVALNNTIIRDNETSCSGAGIYNTGTVNIENSLIMSNTSSMPGGGIRNEASGTAFVTNSTIRNNNDKGVFNAGTMTINRSTINDNAYLFGPDEVSGIYNDGGDLILQNSTLSNNDLYAKAGTVTATNSTLNSSILYHNGTVSLQNSIVMDCAKKDGVSTGVIQSLGHNLDSTTTCGLMAVGDIQGTNLMLAPLADNGGDTETHEPIWGSPAINAGDNEICMSAPINGIDQRGVERPKLNICDIGAYEVDIVLDNEVYLPMINR